MAPPLFQVIVVRAWREADSLRIRLLADGDPGKQWVVGSVEDARDVLGALLSELLAPQAPSEVPRPPQSQVHPAEDGRAPG